MIASITSDDVWAFRFLFAIFAILMLPFASPLMSARLRVRLGRKKVCLILFGMLVVVPGTLALIAPSLLQGHWTALQHKSTKFYVHLATACDLLLQHHPSGTNEVFTIIDEVTGKAVTNSVFWVTVTDPSIPKAIRDMHPIKLQVDSTRVSMLLDSDSRAGIGLAWHPMSDNTNAWVLEMYGDAPATVIFTSNRTALPRIKLQAILETP
jgi:hypothetical protein